jgi:hypothetical protein
MGICHAPPNSAVKERGLTLRRINRMARRRMCSAIDLDRVLLADPLPTAYADDSDALGVSQAMKNMRRASSVSILSGLGVQDPERILEPTSPTQAEAPPDTPTQVQPPTPEPPAVPPKAGVRAFPGARPPSELVTNHLGAFFPTADRKVIERARRMSMLRPQLPGRRDSAASFAVARANQRFSRFSMSTQGSGGVRANSPSRGSTISGISGISNDGSAPRVSLSTDDGRSVELQAAYNLPPMPTMGEGLAAELAASFDGRSSSRQSMYSQYKTKRDKDRSDTASMLTVDEITAEVAEVESRRTSTLIGSEAGDEWTKVGAGGDTEEAITPSDEPEASEEEEEEEDEEEDWAEGSRWVKGALIGAGAFGQVYLGMDAESGLLMAVKQVELPRDSTPNADRKKAMLTALEHEIALLQELRHPHIVQYLHSAIDEEYLNIFLEYVPGGSVTALLHNYGAFEETLVKTFLRQILRGLEYLHAKDIIHRDIKGANILVDNKGTVKISDFGISKKGGAGQYTTSSQSQVRVLIVHSSYRCWRRRRSWGPHLPAGLGLLDGPGGRQADRTLAQGRHLVCWMPDHRDVHGRAPVGEPDADASHLQDRRRISEARDPRGYLRRRTGLPRTHVRLELREAPERGREPYAPVARAPDQKRRQQAQAAPGRGVMISALSFAPDTCYHISYLLWDCKHVVFARYENMYDRLMHSALVHLMLRPRPLVCVSASAAASLDPSSAAGSADTAQS